MLSTTFIEEGIISVLDCCVAEVTEVFFPVGIPCDSEEV